jgi:hypothetical protein
LWAESRLSAAQRSNGSIPENAVTGARRSDDPAPRIVIGWGADGCRMYLIYSNNEIVRATLGLGSCIYDVKVVTGRFDYLVRLIFDDS